MAVCRVETVDCIADVYFTFISGKWPFWLSPRQVRIVPVVPQFEAYAQKVECSPTKLIGLTDVYHRRSRISWWHTSSRRRWTQIKAQRSTRRFATDSWSSSTSSLVCSRLVWLIAAHVTFSRWCRRGAEQQRERTHARQPCSR